MRNWLCILLLLITPNVLAGPFDPPNTDQSIKLLGLIFGPNIGSLPLGGAPNPILSDLVEKFNFIILVVGLIVMSYVAVFSIINTAHEGNAMGQKWSAVWVPMRSIAGLALMIPSPTSGYSMIQVTVMWFVLQGIGAADSIWNIALDGLANNSSPTASNFVNPNLNSDGTALAKNLLNAAICTKAMAKYATTQENVNSNGGAGNWVSQNGQLVKNFVSASPTTTSASNSASVTGISYFGVNNPSVPSDMQICGKLTVIGSVSADDFEDQTLTTAQLNQYATQIYNTKLNIISNMLSILEPIAEGLVDGDYFEPLTSGQTSTIPAPPAGAIVAAAKQYVNTMSGLIVPTLASGSNTGLTPAQQALQTTVSNGKNNGWITAGSFYFVFNQTLVAQQFISATPGHDNIRDSLGTIPSCDTDTCKTSANNNQGFPAGSTVLTNLQNNGLSSQNDIQDLAKLLAQGSVYFTTDSIGSSSSVFSAPGSSGPGSQSVSQALSVSSNANSSVINTLMNLLNNNNGDPLLNQAIFGKTVMLVIESSFVAIVTLALAVGISVMLPDKLVVATFSVPIPRLGSYGLTLVINILSLYAFLLPVFAAMWTFGATLAVYCPLIPYMIFTMAALGWMLTVVEAMIAAPVIALGVIMPSGDEVGRLENAIPILANIFLRPILMIFGFILASRVYMAVVLLINMGMGSVYSSIDTSTMFSALVVLSVYTTFIVSVANTSFSLIYAIPDKILRWIGGGTESTGADAKETLSEAKTAAKDAATDIGKGMSEAGKMAGGKASEMAVKEINKRETAKKYGVEGGKIGPAERPKEGSYEDNSDFAKFKADHPNSLAHDNSNQKNGYYKEDPGYSKWADKQKKIAKDDKKLAAQQAVGYGVKGGAIGPAENPLDKDVVYTNNPAADGIPPPPPLPGQQNNTAAGSKGPKITPKELQKQKSELAPPPPPDDDIPPPPPPEEPS